MVDEKNGDQIMLGRLSGTVCVMQDHGISGGAPFQNSTNLKCLVLGENADLF